MFFFRKNKPKAETQSDSQVIEAYKQSNNVALAALLYERYAHLIYGVCMKYLQNTDDSKDASMQIFEKLITALKQYEIKNFTSWLHIMVKNHCLWLLKMRKNNVVINHNGEENEENFMEKEVFITHQENDDNWELKLEDLDSAINHLPIEQKICINLFYLQQKSYKEISTQTGFDLKKVKSHLQNGKRNLKLYIEEHNEY